MDTDVGVLQRPRRLRLPVKIKEVRESTLIPLLRIPSLGRIGSTKLVLPKWQNIDILNRGIRVAEIKSFLLL